MAKTNGTVPSQEDFEKRRQALERALAYFHGLIETTFRTTAVLDPKAAAKIAALHLNYIQTHVRDVLDERANRFKVASGLELCSVCTQPFTAADPALTRKINAEFAFACALGAIEEIDCASPDHIEIELSRINHVQIVDTLHESKRQHVLWLESKDLTEMPFLSNASYLEILWLCLNIRYQALAT